MPSAFESLYRTHYDFVWRCALRLGGDEALADDLVQETFLIALRRLPDFDRQGPASMSTWLFGILRNTLRNHARGERRREQRHARLRPPDDEEHDPNAAALHVALGSLQGFLDDLDPDRRAVFVLAELEGHNSSEIAQALGINASTARSRLRAARLSFEETFATPEFAAPVSAAIRTTRERPPTGDPERRRASYQLILAAAAGSLAPAVSGVGALSLGWWLAGAGAVLLLLGVVALDGPTRAPQTTAAEVEPVTPASAPAAAPARVQPSPEPSPSVAIPVTPARSSAAPPRDRRSPSTLEVEQVRVVAEARAALLEGDPARALARLDAIETWVSAALEAQATGLEIGALCALRRSEEAKQRSADWASAHPDRPLDARVHELCW